MIACKQAKKIIIFLFNTKLNTIAMQTSKQANRQTGKQLQLVMTFMLIWFFFNIYLEQHPPFLFILFTLLLLLLLFVALFVFMEDIGIAKQFPANSMS